MTEAKTLMMNPIQINVFGVLIAIVFLASIMGVLGWMFAPAEGY
ncbi:hypothetical protein Krac_0302 [Ktedonobacter racemifer DSM 44963]|uniref:Uncharacterized protein n=1 Tax=Ktedonobacter racemifer DSM 44963 TaxID=485913 RepID=D6U7D3_KTERA|nr:hypothetical protein Krac_0302 [Ktedonobacter racemifer DSM 44963]